MFAHRTATQLRTASPPALTTPAGPCSAISGAVCAVLALLILTFRGYVLTQHFLREAYGWVGGNIFGQWVFLVCAVAAGLLSITTGVVAIGTPSRGDRRLGFAGLALSALSLVTLIVWESLIGLQNLFWDI